MLSAKVCWLEIDASIHGCTGVRLEPGTYHVSAKAEDGFHMHVQCSRRRSTPFEVDLSGAFFYFTVRQGSRALTVWVLH